MSNPSHTTSLRAVCCALSHRRKPTRPKRWRQQRGINEILFRLESVRSGGFQTCCIADFQVGRSCEYRRVAGLETCDTADLEVCATLLLVLCGCDLCYCRIVRPEGFPTRS